ncbi:MAG TPA: GtrA family protein [Ktedonobacterales bacterium]|nr:GtrA family protein [Ktedonobacterales bacterium]
MPSGLKAGVPAAQLLMEETVPTPAVHVAAAGASYTPTGVAILDALLAWAEERTSGKAGLLQRVFTYLVIGGFAAVVNLLFLGLFYQVIKLDINDTVHYYVAFALAAEISIFANFIPNDRITFSRLPGHVRSWWARCLRFHSTVIVGTLITLAISSALKFGLKMNFLIAQAIAIIIALTFNFTMHHVWTYRGVGGAH